MRRLFMYLGYSTETFRRMALSFATLGLLFAAVGLVVSAIPYPFELSSGHAGVSVDWSVYGQLRLLYVAFMFAIWWGGAILALGLRQLLNRRLGQRILDRANQPLRETLQNLDSAEREMVRYCRGRVMASIFLPPTVGIMVIAAGAYLPFEVFMIAVSTGALCVASCVVLAGIALHLELAALTRTAHARSNGFTIADFKPRAYILRLWEWEGSVGV